MSRDGSGSDSLDQAAVIQDMINNKGIAAAALKTAPQTHPDFDGKNCVACGDELPPVRLAYGRIRCVICQTILERRR